MLLLSSYIGHGSCLSCTLGRHRSLYGQGATKEDNQQAPVKPCVYSSCLAQKHSLDSILCSVLGYLAWSLSVVRAIVLSNRPPSPGTFLHLAHFLRPPPPPLHFHTTPLNCASGATSSLAQCLYNLVKGFSSLEGINFSGVLVNTKNIWSYYNDRCFILLLHRHNQNINVILIVNIYLRNYIKLKISLIIDFLILFLFLNQVIIVSLCCWLWLVTLCQ